MDELTWQALSKKKGLQTQRHMCLGIGHLGGEGVGVGGVPEAILGGVVARHPPSIGDTVHIGTDSGGREQVEFFVADR